MSVAPKILGGRLTQLSLAALGLALGLGILGSLTGSDWIGGLANWIAPIGGVWVSALRLTVIPLVLTQLLVALTGPRDGRSIGRLGGWTFCLFLAYLVTIGTTTLVAMAPVMRWVSVDPETARILLSNTSVPPEAISALAQPVTTFGEWVQGLVPQNLFAAAVSGDVLPLLVCTIAFGLAVNSLGREQTRPLSDLFHALAAATLQIVFWVLWLTPVAVFALVLEMTYSIGQSALGLLLFYVIAVSVWMLVVSACLYPVSALLGRASLRTFANALAPAHMVAISTRSSLASLPALIEGGRKHLRFSTSITGFVLPFSSSLFKLSTVTAEPVRYLFLTHLFGLDLSLPQTATFLLTLIILSFSGVGVPRGGSGFDTLPAYAAAGIPIEGLVLVVAVDTIPDVAKTLVNVTGQMSVATIASRSERSG